MKKWYILFLLLYAATAKATCQNGTEITAQNGTVFCASGIVLNWFSAFSWCRANGLHLATRTEACPTLTQCPNIPMSTLAGEIWLADPYGEGSAYYIHNANYWVSNAVYTAERTAVKLALCK